MKAQKLKEQHTARVRELEAENLRLQNEILKKQLGQENDIVMEDAKRGDAQAQYYLELRYDHGKGVIVDKWEAVRWYRQAADQGYAPSQYALGWMYQFGEGVTKDEKEAVRWYRQAADQGYARSQYALGWMYQYGVGVPEDKVRSYAWSSLAIAGGDKVAVRSRASLAKRMTQEQLAEAEALSKGWLKRH